MKKTLPAILLLLLCVSAPAFGAAARASARRAWT
jgi:hypothetical protein